MKNYETNSKSTLSLRTNGIETTCDVYSEEGQALVKSLYLKQGAEYKMMYEPKWLGFQVIQFPEDILMIAELVSALKPDVIVECGIAHGGSLILYASLMELAGKGRVLGVDVEIRSHNRINIESHCLSKRITLYEGSSILDETVRYVKDFVGKGQVVLVILDSNHSADHVATELKLYSDIVSVGSYIVAMDGAQAYVSDIPRGKPEWRDDNPLVAIHEFVVDDDRFEIDPYFTRLGMTSNPDAYLKRVK